MSLTPRQRELHDFLWRYHQRYGQAPTIAEVQRHFKLKSPATVHEHLAVLERAGYIKRHKHVGRGIELVESIFDAGEQGEIPLLGIVAAGGPIEAILNREMISVPREWAGPRRFALRVRGDSMVDEHICHNDLIVVEQGSTAENGDIVVALIDGHSATIKTFFREGKNIRLQPANKAYKPIIIKPPREVTIQGCVKGILRRY
ncbi:MAG TPA: transcriptional repressor LexA [Blastocatellia bacterium]|nr:transcriptional repressor LexA [Blastocatellia bacterium]